MSTHSEVKVSKCNVKKTYTLKQYIPGEKESYTEDEILEFLLYHSQDIAIKCDAEAKPVAEPSVIKPSEPITKPPSKLAETKAVDTAKTVAEMKPVAEPSTIVVQPSKPVAEMRPVAKPSPVVVQPSKPVAKTKLVAKPSPVVVQPPKLAETKAVATAKPVAQTKLVAEPSPVVAQSFKPVTEMKLVAIASPVVVQPSKLAEMKAVAAAKQLPNHDQ
jgi:hypothetical protein